MRNLGWIVLDVDGTITYSKSKVPLKIQLYIESLSKTGWNIAFLTGRTFSFAYQALSSFQCPFYLGVQNGAELIQMPEKKLLYKNFLDFDVLTLFEDLFRDENGDFLVYSGSEKGDFCYFRPHKFNDEQLAYLEDLKLRRSENWHAVEKFQPETIPQFSFIKCFGSKALMKKILSKLENIDQIEVVLNRDYHNKEYHLLLITKKDVSKKAALLWLLSKKNGFIISAGDDLNDLGMLSMSDIKIVMSTAPDKLKQIADFIAPRAEDLGIIEGLDFALQNRPTFEKSDNHRI